MTSSLSICFDIYDFKYDTYNTICREMQGLQEKQGNLSAKAGPTMNISLAVDTKYVYYLSTYWTKSKVMQKRPHITCTERICALITGRRIGDHFSIKMPSYRYRDSRVRD